MQAQLCRAFAIPGYSAAIFFKSLFTMPLNATAGSEKSISELPNSSVVTLAIINSNRNRLVL